MFKKIILMVVLLGLLRSIEIPLHQGRRCMIIMTAFEPVKVQVIFPEIPNKRPDEKYKMTIIDTKTKQVMQLQTIQQKTTLRKPFKIPITSSLSICFQILLIKRILTKNQQIYIDYTTTQDFQSLIGKIQIPQELLKQQNLKSIFQFAKQLTQLNKKIQEHQKKERDLEDQLAGQNIHKNQRIVSLTLIECLVILLSGTYQIFTLRKFMIEKNIY